MTVRIRKVEELDLRLWLPKYITDELDRQAQVAGVSRREWAQTLLTWAIERGGLGHPIDASPEQP